MAQGSPRVTISRRRRSGRCMCRHGVYGVWSNCLSSETVQNQSRGIGQKRIVHMRVGGVTRLNDQSRERESERKNLPTKLRSIQCKDQLTKGGYLLLAIGIRNLSLGPVREGRAGANKRGLGSVSEEGVRKVIIPAGHDVFARKRDRGASRPAEDEG